MAFDDNTVKRVAHLARLEISEDELPGFHEQLTKVLTMVEQVNEVNTDGIKPMAHPLDANQRLRDDEVTHVDQSESFLAIAPVSEDGLYLVPAVIEDKS